MIEIIDNFLPKSLENKIANIFLDPNTTWSLNSSVINDNLYNNDKVILDHNTKDSPQLVHPMLIDGKVYSENFHICSTLLYFLESNKKISIKNLHRIKTNLLFNLNNFKNNEYHPAHVDSCEKDTKTLIYYPIDSDGDTFLFNEFYPASKKQTLSINNTISPKQGRAVFFDSNRFHAGSNPIKTQIRLSINFIFSV